MREPDMPFHHLRAPKSVDWGPLCNSETSMEGFGGSKIVTGSVGRWWHWTLSIKKSDEGWGSLYSFFFSPCLLTTHRSDRCVPDFLPACHQPFLSSFLRFLPYEPFHSFRASRSEDRWIFNIVWERRATDFEAPKLWKGMCVLPDRPFHHFWASQSRDQRILCTSGTTTSNDGFWSIKMWNVCSCGGHSNLMHSLRVTIKAISLLLASWEPEKKVETDWLPFFLHLDFIPIWLLRKRKTHPIKANVLEATCEQIWDGQDDFLTMLRVSC